MLTDDPEYVLYLLHKRQRQARRRARFLPAGYSRARSLDPRKELAGCIEHLARAILAAMGYQVARTGYNAPFDLWAEGARVEVKAATYASGRYQAAIRNHQADLLLLACQTPAGGLEWFVIPGDHLGDIKNLAIWTEDPAQHNGRWFEYYQAWWWVDSICQRVPAHRGWQPELL